MAKALIIDDEKDICELIEMALIGQGVACEMVHSVKAAIKKLKENEYDFAICDVRLPDGDGLDLLAHIQKQYPQMPVCIITAHGNMDMAIKALKLGAFDFINKPFDLKQLRAISKQAIKKQSNSEGKTAGHVKQADEVRRRAKEDRADDTLIGRSAEMARVRAMIVKVARSQAPIFIHGESGTGKEIVARAVHNQSVRASGPFIAVNCGAIPENLVESEFFGYKKGSFTGANQDQDGLFVSANGGTLFLDEVADLPLAMQVKLLRAIQERAVRPIGGDKEERVDVRIVSATHQDLERNVEEGAFREDLYYRLNVIGLDLPPLRERIDDIAELSEYLLQKLVQQSGYQMAELSKNALDVLKHYQFPGNVRELENILERALTFVDGDMIEVDDLQLNDAQLKNIEEKKEIEVDRKTNDKNGKIAALSDEHKNTPDSKIPKDLEEYLLETEKKILLKALEDCEQNKTKVAKSLGINLRTLRYKLKKLGIE